MNDRRGPCNTMHVTTALCLVVPLKLPRVSVPIWRHLHYLVSCFWGIVSRPPFLEALLFRRRIFVRGPFWGMVSDGSPHREAEPPTVSADAPGRSSRGLRARAGAALAGSHLAGPGGVYNARKFGAGRAVVWSPSSGLSHRFFFGWEGSPTKVDYRKKGTLIPTSLLEDLVGVFY